MAISHVVIVGLAIAYFIFLVIVYIFNPFKWRFIKRSRETEKTDESIELYDRGREALLDYIHYVEKIRNFASIDPFVRYRYGWIGGKPIDTIYPALEGLRLLKDDNFFTKEERNLDRLLLSFFREKQGFCLNSIKNFPSIHASHCGIGATKSIINRACEQRLTYKTAVDKLKPWRINTILNFLHECGRDPSRLIVDNPEKSKAPNINVLYNTARLLWNLEREGEIFKIAEKDRLMKFLKGCFDGHGFKSTPRDKRVSIETTYFSLKILEVIPEIDFIKSKEQREIAKFLHACWQGNGFSSVPETTVALNYTYFAILTFDMLKEEVSLDCNKIFDFVQNCKSGMGFGSREDFEPTCYATRYAIQILDYLKSKNLIDKSLTNDRKEELNKFFKKNLYDYEIASF